MKMCENLWKFKKMYENVSQKSIAKWIGRKIQNPNQNTQLKQAQSWLKTWGLNDKWLGLTHDDAECNCTCDDDFTVQRETGLSDRLDSERAAKSVTNIVKIHVKFTSKVWIKLSSKFRNKIGDWKVPPTLAKKDRQYPSVFYCVIPRGAIWTTSKEGDL